MDESRIRNTDGEGDELDAVNGDDLPIVARLVVEIRSDGSRTVARGAMEDKLNGQTVGVEARADSPLELSRALAKMVFSTPFAALLNRGRDGGRDGGQDDADTGVRAKVGALGRRLGDRLRDRGLRLPGRESNK